MVEEDGKFGKKKEKEDRPRHEQKGQRVQIPHCILLGHFGGLDSLENLKRPPAGSRGNIF